MQRTVNAEEAQRSLGELLDGVSRGDEVVIEREGRPIAAVVPIHPYKTFQRSRDVAREEFFQLVDQIHERNRGIPAEEVDREIELALREVRSSRRPDAGQRPAE